MADLSLTNNLPTEKYDIDELRDLAELLYYIVQNAHIISEVGTEYSFNCDQLFRLFCCSSYLIEDMRKNYLRLYEILRKLFVGKLSQNFDEPNK